MARTICAEAVSLVKSFEGLSLSAYPDPGSPDGIPWTIGYGHAGGDVFPGDVITEDEAEELLRLDLKRFEEGVERLIPRLEYHEFCALTSWAFNVGLGAVESSTLRRRILSGEDHETVIREELPRWNKGASGVMAGLVRRRAAEVDHAALSWLTSGSEALEGDKLTPTPSEDTEDGTEPSVILLEDFFEYYAGKSWQRSGVLLLQQALAEQAPGLLLDSSAWVQEYRNSPPEREPEQPDGEVILDVPYLYQFDSDTEQGARMCFSSTNAMLLEYLRPGTLKGVQADDAYLMKVLEYGDTTSAEAQVAALNSYGLEAYFRTDGTTALAKDLLSASIPVSVGVLHHGHVSQPQGGGHWLLLVGFDDLAQQWICHDPAGEMDVVGGGYVDSSPTAGRFVRYSYENLGRRWMVAGEGDGWCIEANP